MLNFKRIWRDLFGRRGRVRGFERVRDARVTAKLPSRGTRTSAAYDLISPESVLINPGSSHFLKTDIKAYMPPEEALLVFMRSSMGKKGLELMNKVAVIDSDFYSNSTNDGNITLMLHNCGTAPIQISAGDKLAQGMFVAYALADGDSFDSHVVRRNGGIGSTGA